jgi:hypothetical protein
MCRRASGSLPTIESQMEGASSEDDDGRSCGCKRTCYSGAGGASNPAWRVKPIEESATADGAPVIVNCGFLARLLRYRRPTIALPDVPAWQTRDRGIAVYNRGTGMDATAAQGAGSRSCAVSTGARSGCRSPDIRGSSLTSVFPYQSMLDAQYYIKVKGADIEFEVRAVSVRILQKAHKSGKVCLRIRKI